MEFGKLLDIVGDEPVFETGLLLAGDINPNDVRRQLTRWTNAGKLYQLRRGLYALAPPYQKIKPHPFLIANRLAYASYVSCQSALAYYGIIPEYVPVVTSVTTGRPRRWSNPLGQFDFHHIQAGRLAGYDWIALDNRQHALVAKPTKALLDLVYLHPSADKADYLRELRLQRLEMLDLREASQYVDAPKLRRALASLSHLLDTEATSYDPL